MKIEWICVPIAFFATYFIIKWMLCSGAANIAIDSPCARSLHNEAMPRSGGLGIIAGVAAGWGVLADGLALHILLIAAALSAISLLDDIKGLHAGYRLSIHIILASLFVGLTVWPMINIYAAFAAMLAISWMTNLFNFMDGSDGLAGGMAVSGFGFYALSAFMSGDIGFCLISLVVVSSAGAFLTYNFHPARIFMGDAGSTFLGFLSGAIGLAGWQKGLWSLWTPLLIFSPFIADTTMTLMKRLFRGEKIWKAHREHYYQRLIQMGYGHKKTAILEYFFMVSTGIFGCFLPRDASKWYVIAFVAFIYLIFMSTIDICWQKFIFRRHDLIKNNT